MVRGRRSSAIAIVAVGLLLLSAGRATAQTRFKNSDDKTIQVVYAVLDDPPDQELASLVSQRLSLQEFTNELTSLENRGMARVLSALTDEHLARRICKSKAYLLIGYFDDKGMPITADAAKITHLKVRVGERTEPYRIEERNSAYYLKTFDEIPDIAKAGHGTMLGFNVAEAGTMSWLNSPMVFAKRNNRWDVYGLDVSGNQIVGLWAPVGLFATNGRRVEGAGMEFTAMPVGGALGGRWWLAEKFFLGFSAIGMWAITNTEESTKGPTTANRKEGVVHLGSLGAGLLVDVSSWAYLSGTYHWDFEKNASAKDPGPMIGVGVGAGLLNLIANGNLPMFMR